MRRLIVGLLLSTLAACGGGSSSENTTPVKPNVPPADPSEPMYIDTVAYMDACEADPKAPALSAAIQDLLQKYDSNELHPKFDATTVAIVDQRNISGKHPNAAGCATAIVQASSARALEQMKAERAAK